MAQRADFSEINNINNTDNIDTSEATIYFGGGTPSLLSAASIDILAQEAVHRFGIRHVVEFTIEANPDDITTEYLADIRNIGVDRISIGIQSLCDEDLSLLHRRHTARQAIDSVHIAQDAGFRNISVDLMYGLPRQTFKRWQKTLWTAFSLDIQHLSAYCLTAEPHTPLADLVQKKIITLPTDDTAASHYEILRNAAQQHGFQHYETSNFALPHRHSLHNSNYWCRTPYIGIGAAAHSYCGNVRRHNTADIAAYVNGVAEGSIYYTAEILSPVELYNELILTGLRTRRGVDIKDIVDIKNAAAIDTAYLCCLQRHFQQNAEKLMRSGLLVRHSGRYIIPHSLWFKADGIMLDLIADKKFGGQ